MQFSRKTNIDGHNYKLHRTKIMVKQSHYTPGQKLNEDCDVFDS